MEVNVKDDSKPSPKKPSDSKKPPGKPGAGKGGPPPGPGGQQSLHHPPVGVPKAGQGIDPMSAMMGGLPPELLSQMGPPPPPSPGSPMGPNGLPVGGNLPSSDPMYDQAMDGSSLFKALNMQLDPYAAGPGGESLQDPTQGDPQMGLEGLLSLLALNMGGAGAGGMGQPMGGMGRLNPSGVANDPTHPGETMGLNPFNVIQ